MDDIPVKKQNRIDNQVARKRRVKKSGMGFMKAMKNVYEKLKNGR